MRLSVAVTWMLRRPPKQWLPSMRLPAPRTMICENTLPVHSLSVTRQLPRTEIPLVPFPETTQPTTLLPLPAPIPLARLLAAVQSLTRPPGLTEMPFPTFPRAVHSVSTALSPAAMPVLPLLTTNTRCRRAFLMAAAPTPNEPQPRTVPLIIVRLVRNAAEKMPLREELVAPSRTYPLRSMTMSLAPMVMPLIDGPPVRLPV